MQNSRYPSDNAITFERWYMDAYLDTDTRDRLYLPIQWTALYVNGDYGKDSRVKQQIQTFINSLDKSKKYYTIVQYDDGILNDLSALDILVCAMSGPRIDYPIPLLCQPHKFRFQHARRDIFASFVGTVTHDIRAKMVENLRGLKDYYIRTTHHNLREYCEVMARSKYVLCPRGYGQSSFRIQEAIEYGAIPVYISDHFIRPYAIEENIGILYFSRFGKGDLEFVDSMLDCKRQQQIIEDNRHLFTYGGCKKKILEHLKNGN